MSRRAVLAVGAGAAGVLGAAASGAEAALATVARRFFTPAELALVDELTEMIVPADDHSPGARAAKVAAFIDARLAEAFEDSVRTTWRQGLAAIDRAASAAHGRPFLKLDAALRESLLTAMAANERTPSTTAERFFVELKRWTVKGYYSSAIGIHQEMEYKGNTLLQEYVGTDIR